MRRQAVTRPGRIEPQSGQRAGRLPHDQGRVRAGGPGDVAEPLDRVHLADPTPARATVPRRGERPVPGADPTPIQGEGRTLEQWLTTFHLVSVVIDPYTNESAWILDTAARIMRNFTGAASG